MPFEDLEISNHDGIPQTLFEFRLGSTYWYYTNSPADLVHLGKTYIAMAISQDGIKQSGEVDGDEITITLPHEATFNVLFLGTPPSEEILVTIRRKQFGESDAAVVWIGTVKSNRRNQDRITNRVVCKMLIASLNRPGLRLSYGRNCPHALYDLSCTVDKANYATVVTVDTLTGNSVFSTGIDALPDGYLDGGFLEFVRTGITDAKERRAIESHVGNRIRLLGIADGMVPGDMIIVYPGCARTVLACKNKFNNLPNYGGFPQLPGKSPFDGDPVF